jgi:hypothetical protein
MSKRTMALLAAALAALPLAGCTQAPAASASASARHTPPAAVAAGAAVDCVRTSLIEDTRVFGDSTIDFHMRSGVTYRNTLPHSCPNLGFDERFGYKTTNGQLCSIDTITVLPTGSSIPGPTCGLGPFQPVKLASR